MVAPQENACKWAKMIHIYRLVDLTNHIILSNYVSPLNNIFLTKAIDNITYQTYPRIPVQTFFVSRLVHSLSSCPSIHKPTKLDYNNAAHTYSTIKTQHSKDLQLFKLRHHTNTQRKNILLMKTCKARRRLTM